MHRARKLAVAVVVAACALVSASRAHAFHAGASFAKSASAGGGGGLYYTGAPGERRWDCRACHLDAPGTIRAGLSANPPSLFDTGSYVPGESYVINVKLIGEHAGLDTPATNTNGLTLAIVDVNGAPAGSIVAFAPDMLLTTGPATIASTGDHLGATEWSFTWRAPNASLGRVAFHVALVDGDGARTSAPGAFSDPWGDDVFVARIPVEQSSHDTHRSSAPAALGLAFGLAILRRRRA